MVLRPVFYLADFMSGDLIYRFPMDALTVDRLRSSLEPGVFDASLDLRKAAESMAEARSILALMDAGTTTLVPVLEGTSAGVGNPPISRELGEWWIPKVNGSIKSPIVSLSGPEFAGYLSHLLVTQSWTGDALDPVATARDMLREAFTTDQTVAVDLQGWVSHTDARVPVDVRLSTTDYWSAITGLQDHEDGPFEWLIRSGLVQDGWTPQRVTRTLEVGQPVMDFQRPGITLEVTAPGLAPASLLDADWSRDEARAASTVYGFGAGSGDDQVRAYESRSRMAGEPGKSRRISVRDAMSPGQLRPHVRAALARATPTNHVFPATMPTDRYTPRTGEVYSWRNDESWTQPARAGSVRCVGWAWNPRSDTYTLDLVEV